ncbi:unnamed protein product [Phaeothamnion confervicola]
MFIVAGLTLGEGLVLRHALMMAGRVVERVWREPRFATGLGYHLFGSAAALLTEEPKWLRGNEWDVLSLARLIYVKLVMGGTATDAQASNGRRTPVSDIPRRILLEVVGLPPAAINELEAKLKQSGAVRDQKDAMRDALRATAERRRREREAAGGDASAASVSPEESIMLQRRSAFARLPGKMRHRSAQIAARAPANGQGSAGGEKINIADLFGLDAEL